MRKNFLTITLILLLLGGYGSLFGQANCQANFAAFPDTSGQSCTTVFSNLSTGNSLSYFWSFGDGNHSSSVNPTHTYTNPGVYNVCLFVQGNFSPCQDSVCSTVTVTCGSTSNCQALFTAIPDTSGQNCNAFFQNQSIGNNLFYFWDFGDGNSSNATNPFHSYANPGTYTVCLTTYNNVSNCSDTLCQSVTVNCGGGNCQADFVAYPDTNGQSCTVWFASTSQGSNLQYNWDFGDGSYSSQANPGHTYGLSGTYNVCLIILSNTSNCIDTLCMPVTVNCQVGNNCNANFAAYPDTSGQSCTVWFTNNSTGSGLNYDWYFGDGNYSNQTNPNHTYTQSGTYNVCLIVYDSLSSCVDSVCQNVTVACNSSGNCQAGFIAYPDTSGQNCRVFFSNTSTGSNLQYNWDFGDGAISSQVNPSHTYGQSGTYNVCLLVWSNSSNCVDTLCMPVTINCQGGNNCQAAFTAYPDTNGQSCTVWFANNSIGSNLLYDWDFGDGSFSTQANPNHTYSQSGTYSVCLIILSTNSNCLDTLCLPVTVNCQSGNNCQANFVAYPDTNGQSCTVWFTNNSTGAGLTYDWYFGDGNSSNQTNPSHTYTQSGTYNVCLIVYDSLFSCVDSLCQNVTVSCGSSSNCQANFIAYPDTNGQSCTVWFNNNSTGSNLLYNWDFGDGGFSSQANPNHTYSQSGTYNVCLLVWSNSSNCVDTLCMPVTVNCQSGNNCQANFAAYPDTSGQTCTVWFTNNSTGAGLTYDWYFGDGNFSNQTNPSHTYTQSGTYNVCLIVYDSLFSCVDSLCQNVTVSCGSSSNCQANFIAYPDTNGQSCTVWFNNNSTGSNLLYNWDFGDGGFSSQANPNHTYSQSGTYNVCLLVWSNSSNCVDTLCMPVTVNCQSGNNCQANFAAYPDTSGQTCTVWFTNNSTGAGLTYDWYFGDGNFSNQTNPSHTYTQSGTYNVCLIVYDSLFTCVDSLCQNVTVSCGSSSNCQANFNAYPDTTGQTCAVVFNNLSSGIGLNYSWNFGDGNTSNGSNPVHTYGASGTYTVCLTIWDSLNVCADSMCSTVTVNCIANSSASAASEGLGLRVSPNPTDNLLNIQFDLAKAGEAKLSLVDLQGRTVWENGGVLQTAGAQRLEISLNNLPAGLYFLRLESNGLQQVQKIIKR